MNEEVLLTAEGLEKVKEEYDQATSVTRREVAARIKEAREFGDISENAEYDAAKNEQAELEQRINKLESMMRNAKIIEEGASEGGRINVGSVVTLQEGGNSEMVEFRIVGSTEADPFEGKISNESAVGAALLGARVGETVDVEIPDGKIQYAVINIDKK